MSPKTPKIIINQELPECATLIPYFDEAENIASRQLSGVKWRERWISHPSCIPPIRGKVKCYYIRRSLCNQFEQHIRTQSSIKPKKGIKQERISTTITWIKEKAIRVIDNNPLPKSGNIYDKLQEAEQVSTEKLPNIKWSAWYNSQRGFNLPFERKENCIYMRRSMCKRFQQYIMRNQNGNQS